MVGLIIHNHQHPLKVLVHKHPAPKCLHLKAVDRPNTVPIGGENVTFFSLISN